VGRRTIIEINHDHLKAVAGEIAILLQMLPHASERELKEQYRYCSAIKILAQRDSYDTIKLEIE